MWLTFNLYPLQTEIYKAMICFKESTGKKKKKKDRKFPDNLVVRIHCFHCSGLGSIPSWGTKIQKATQCHPSNKNKKQTNKNPKTTTPKQNSVLRLTTNEERAVGNVFIIICIFISISGQFLDTEIKKYLHFLSS